MVSHRETIDQLKQAIQALEHNTTPSTRKYAHRHSSAAPKSAARTQPKLNEPEGAPCDSASRAKGSAFQKTVELLNVQERSSEQLRSRLHRYSFSDEDIEAAIARAQECGLVDDLRYADILIRSRISQGWGSIGIENELKREHIDINDVPGWPLRFPVSDDEELERALTFLDRKPTHSKNLRDGAFKKLVQKGYPVSIASKAAQQWAENRIDTCKDY